MNAVSTPDTSTRTQILTEYLQYVKLQNRPFAERKSTLLTYFCYLDEAGTDFLRLSISQAQDFQRHLAMKIGESGAPYYATATVISMMGRITSFYDYLKMKKLIPYNPFTEIARLRGEKSLPRDILSAEELAGVLAVLKDFMAGKTSADQRRRYKAHVIAELMYSTGARIHEIARLTVDDVDFGRGVVLLRDQKTGVERYGILNEYASKVLKLYVEQMREYALTGRSDRRLLFGSFLDIRRLVNEMMSEACREKGFKHRFTSHGFRHCMGSHLLKNGCDIRYIQEMLGHESIGTTQIYTRVVKEDLRGVIDEYHPRSLARKSGPVEARD
jgi:integrase/recombinase XerD